MCEDIIPNMSRWDEGCGVRLSGTPPGCGNDVILLQHFAGTISKDSRGRDKAECSGGGYGRTNRRRRWKSLKATEGLPHHEQSTSNQAGGGGGILHMRRQEQPTNVSNQACAEYERGNGRFSLGAVAWVWLVGWWEGGFHVQFSAFAAAFPATVAAAKSGSTTCRWREPVRASQSPRALERLSVLTSVA